MGSILCNFPVFSLFNREFGGDFATSDCGHSQPDYCSGPVSASNANHRDNPRGWRTSCVPGCRTFTPFAGARRTDSPFSLNRFSGATFGAWKLSFFSTPYLVSLSRCFICNLMTNAMRARYTTDAGSAENLAHSFSWALVARKAEISQRSEPASPHNVSSATSSQMP